MIKDKHLRCSSKSQDLAPPVEPSDEHSNTPNATSEAAPCPVCENVISESAALDICGVHEREKSAEYTTEPRAEWSSLEVKVRTLNYRYQRHPGWKRVRVNDIENIIKQCSTHIIFHMNNFLHQARLYDIIYFPNKSFESSWWNDSFEAKMRKVRQQRSCLLDPELNLFEVEISEAHQQRS